MVKRCHRLYSLPFAEVTSLKDGQEVVGGGAWPLGIPPQPFDLLGLWVLQTAPGTLGLLTPALPCESGGGSSLRFSFKASNLAEQLIRFPEGTSWF